MRGKRLSIGVRAALAIFTVTVLVTSTWAATNWKEKVLHTFSDNGTDGADPEAGLIFDAAGNLYGTTYVGGAYGEGTVFELTPAAGGGWTERVLYSFCSQRSCTDGETPGAGLIFDAAGNLYGTTSGGGTGTYFGTVFELTPTAGGGWMEQVLHSFNGGDGYWPFAGLIFDAAGNLYGTTYVGGAYGEGTVFELTPAAGGGWTERVLYSFCSQRSCTDGETPGAGLIFDAAGNLYGTTSGGGTGTYFGTVFELTPTAGGGWMEQVLHSFNGGDGYWPFAGLIFDAAGNLYGTTYVGGAYGEGTVFELTPAAGGGWTERVLYSFCSQRSCTDGETPGAGLIFDAAGNLYGTTSGGGTGTYFGTVFELTPTAGGGWMEQVLHSFNGGDGYWPFAGLIFDAAGNLYGTTYVGGAYGEGTVFELTPAAGGGWTERVLYSFCSQRSCTDGETPGAGLIFDAAGNLYGTTSGGGTGTYFGTVFELTPTAGGGWMEQVLHSFNGGDGYWPFAGLIFDAAGNLYGTTYVGGAYGEGTVFELTPAAGGGWTEQVLYNFKHNGTDGYNPEAGLIFDKNGNLYSTTLAGGTYGEGTVFELRPTAGGDWTEEVLHSFGNGTDGYQPAGSLMFDAAGNLYGTTYGGGTYGYGTVFELTPTAGGGWTEKVLHSFGNGPDGYYPYAGLIFDAAGNLYSTTHGGGTYGYGTVFELTPTAGGSWTETVL